MTATADAPAQPAEPNLADLLGQSLPDNDAAWRQLFGLWGAAYDRLPGTSVCDRAAEAGLECRAGRADAAWLAALRLPAALELVGADGSRHYLLLTAIEPGRATLVQAQAKLAVPQPDLLAHWSGAYVVLWRRPEGARPLLRSGMRGTDVTWLRHAMEQLQTPSVAVVDSGDPPRDPARELAREFTGDRGGGAATTFDGELAAAVRRFQAGAGLQVDGVVGAETWFQLLRRLPPAAATGTTVPALSPSNQPES